MSNGLLLGPLEFFRFKFISEIGAFPKPLFLLATLFCQILLDARSDPLYVRSLCSNGTKREI